VRTLVVARGKGLSGVCAYATPSLPLPPRACQVLLAIRKHSDAARGTSAPAASGRGSGGHGDGESKEGGTGWVREAVDATVLDPAKRAEVEFIRKAVIKGARPLCVPGCPAHDCALRFPLLAPSSVAAPADYDQYAEWAGGRAKHGVFANRPPSHWRMPLFLLVHRLLTHTHTAPPRPRCTLRRLVQA
jgi:hypothetical protein